MQNRKLSRIKGSQIKGLSLIELLLVLAILAIVAAIATPMYSGYAQQVRRSEARVALQALALAQQRYYLAHGHYVQVSPASLSAPGLLSGALPGSLNGTQQTEHGYYQIQLEPAVAGDPHTFRLSATALPDQAQAGDQRCQSFSINHLGLRSAYDRNGQQSSADCW